MKIRGKVIEGDGYGRKLGYPTVNLDRDDYQAQNLDLPFGIYAGLVEIVDTTQAYPAGIIIGPQDAWGLPKLEAHLIGFDGDLYGETVAFHIRDFIRAYKDYGSVSDLRTDIAKDIATIKNLNLTLK